MTYIEPRAMKEIHDIRLKLYEEKKNMTSEERAEATRRAVREMEALYGIKFKRPESMPPRESFDASRENIYGR